MLQEEECRRLVAGCASQSRDAHTMRAQHYHSESVLQEGSNTMPLQHPRSRRRAPAASAQRRCPARAWRALAAGGDTARNSRRVAKRERGPERDARVSGIEPMGSAAAARRNRGNAPRRTHPPRPPRTERGCHADLDTSTAFPVRATFAQSISARGKALASSRRRTLRWVRRRGESSKRAGAHARDPPHDVSA